ncbi:MAG: NTP transferase domain-containing protein [archaeon]|nr:NTP transferase domain-containing protein [archaeon]
MKLKKAVILAAGEGKRLLPITATRPKHLIPIAGKPLIQYTVEYLKEAGIDEILFIVGYLKEKFIDYFKDGTDFGVKIQYKEQVEFLGTANAAQLGEEFTGNEPFMLIYGDLLLDKQVFKLGVETYNKSKTDGLICVFEVPDPQKYGIIQLDQNGCVKQIVEKPEDDRYGNLINAGVFIFNSKIFEGIKKTRKSPRGEYEFTDSMQILVNEGYKIIGLDISGKYWSDVGHPWQLLDANKYLIDNMVEKSNGVVEDGVYLKGRVHIGKGTIVKSGSYIEGPVFIGDNCVIGPGAFIRPYSSIGNNCRVGNSSEIKNTVLLEHTYMSHFSYLGDSIIGSNVNFGAGTVISNVKLEKNEILMNIKGKRVTTGRKKMGAVIGDNTQLGINSLIMTGIKIGRNARIGSGTIVSEDIPDWGLVYVKQEHIKKVNKKK